MKPLIYLAIFMISLLGTAQAQMGLGGDEDIFVNATKATYKGNLTILEDNVDVRQGNAQVLSDIMHIYRAKAESSVDSSIKMGTVTRIEAKGNFVYITPETRVTGLKGVYEKSTGMITVTGNVRVKQASGDTAQTDKLLYNTKTETIRFKGDCLGKNCQSRSTIRLSGTE